MLKADGCLLSLAFDNEGKFSAFNHYGVCIVIFYKLFNNKLWDQPSFLTFLEVENHEHCIL